MVFITTLNIPPVTLASRHKDPRNTFFRKSENIDSSLRNDCATAPQVFQKSMIKLASRYETKESIVFDRLMQSTEALRAWKEAVFVETEQILLEAMCALWPSPGRRAGLRLVAMAARRGRRDPEQTSSELFRQEGETLTEVVDQGRSVAPFPLFQGQTSLPMSDYPSTLIPFDTHPERQELRRGSRHRAAVWLTAPLAGVALK